MSHLNRAARRAASSIAIGGMLAAPAMAGAAGSQPVDVTAQLTCDGALAGQPTSVRVEGTVPASTRQGEFLDPTNLALTVQHSRGTATTHGSAPFRYVAGLNRVTMQASGGEGGDLFVGGSTNTVTALGAERWEVETALNPDTGLFVGGTQPVKLALTATSIEFTIANPVLLLTEQVPTTSSSCTVDGSAVALATIANAGAAPAGPPTVAVSSATETEGINSFDGGLLYLRGTNLKGVRTIKFGPHTVRVVLNTGSTIYALVPPLDEFGTWPVTVSRADGTTSAVDPGVTVTIYEGGFGD